MQLAQYIRMSTAHQEDSPETQKSVIREYCALHNHTIVRTYEDLGISGGSMEKRDGLLELLMDAEKRLFEGVIIYKYDRAFRNLAEQVFALRKLQKYGIKVIAAADPNAEGASGELIRNILGAVNQFERQLTGERIYDKNRQLAKKGIWTGSGINPLGYQYDKEEKKLLIIPEESELVRYIYELYLETKSSLKVAEILRSEGYRTKTGKIWSAEAVCAVLNNPLYVGYRRWGYIRPGKHGRNPNCEVFKGNHEAIIPEEMFQEVQRIMNENKKRHRRGPGKRVYLLSGLLRCLKCKGIVAGAYQAHIKKGAYLCKERYRRGICSGWTRVCYKLDDAVYNMVLKNIARAALNEYYDEQDPDPGPGKQKPELSLEKQIRALEKKLERQIDLYEEGIISKDEFKKRREATLKEKEALEKQLQEREPKPVSKEVMDALINFESVWAGLTMLEKKELLKTLIDAIYSDGHWVKIIFKDLGIPGWLLEAEMPVI